MIKILQAMSFMCQYVKSSFSLFQVTTLQLLGKYCDRNYKLNFYKKHMNEQMSGSDLCVPLVLN